MFKALKNYLSSRITLGERVIWTVGSAGTFGLMIYSLAVEGHI